MNLKPLIVALTALTLTPLASAATYSFRVTAPGAKAVDTGAPPPSAVFATMSTPEAGEVLSNSNRTITHNAYGVWSRAQATVGKSAGKWYWEMTLDSMASGALMGSIPQGYPAGAYFQSGAFNLPGGYIYGSPGVSAAAVSQGDTVGVMLDMDNLVISYMVRCAAPVQMGGTLPQVKQYPFTEGQSGTQFTLNFGSVPFKCKPPANYNKGLWQ